MNSDTHRHPKNFEIAISILFSIKKNNGKLDSDLDRNLLQLWVYTLMIGTGHIRKEAQAYTITEKGEDELRRHAHNKMLIIAT
jgi:hypothetical protein